MRQRKFLSHIGKLLTSFLVTEEPPKFLNSGGSNDELHERLEKDREKLPVKVLFENCTLFHVSD